MNKLAVVEKAFATKWSFAVDGGVQGNFNTGIFIPIGSIFVDISFTALTASGPGAGKVGSFDLQQSGVSLFGGAQAAAGNIAAGTSFIVNASAFTVPASDGTQLIFVIGGADPAVTGSIEMIVTTLLTRA